ncbi:MAG: hypothetical protein IK102_07665 [Treponema sp.]|nr:hypothetical protein [Treponema sp.]
MKKLAFFALSVFLILSLISCGSKKPAEDTTEPTPPVEETVEETIEDTASGTNNELALASMNAARQAAIDSGAQNYSGFDALEDEYARLQERAANGEDVADECAELAKKYEALAAYVKAYELKARIDGYDVPPLAKAVYNQGSDDLAAYEELAANPDSKADDMLAKATGAYASFKSVFAALAKELAKDARNDALAAKKDADSVKAAVSQKREYNRAAELFKKGDSSYSMSGFEAAFDYYDQAEDIFSALYADISEKRAAALAAIEAAKKSVEESASVAEEADREAPLSGNVDGIEDEDAVLLDEDNYADPEDAEVYLDEDISIGGDDK